MKASQLRASILQQAVEGKLVPQIPEEGTAADLLESIRAEREALIKAGKIKKAKPLPKITEDEIPFEIPESWEWVRLGFACDVRDGTHDTPKYYTQGIPLITSKNLDDGKLDFENVQYISEEDYLEISTRSKVDVGDILYAMIGSIGNPVLVVDDRKFGIKNVALFKLLKNAGLNEDFLYWYLYYAQERMKSEASGGVQVFVSLQYLRKYLLPLPPLAEQKRIVAKLEELMPLIDAYEKEEEKLSALEKSLPEKLRRSVLQQAVEGKLVPKRAEEGTAAELLKEIEKERAELVKAGKMKKAKPLPEITEEEIPFEIPESWEWVRFGQLVSISSGLSYNKENLKIVSKDMVTVLRGGNIFELGYKITQDDIRISREFINKDELFLRKGQLITPAVTSLENICKAGLIEKDYHDVVAGGFVLNIIPYKSDDTFSRYNLYLFSSPYMKKRCKNITNKSGQAFYNLSRDKLLSVTVPLPPLAEQKRIVAKVEELMQIIDKL